MYVYYFQDFKTYNGLHRGRMSLVSSHDFITLILEPFNLWNHTLKTLKVKRFDFHHFVFHFLLFCLRFFDYLSSKVCCCYIRYLWISMAANLKSLKAKLQKSELLNVMKFPVGRISWIQKLLNQSFSIFCYSLRNWNWLVFKIFQNIYIILKLLHSN